MQECAGMVMEGGIQRPVTTTKVQPSIIDNVSTQQIGSPNVTTNDVILQVLQQSQCQQQALLDTFQLPKAEIMTFDGDPIKYWQFIRVFETVVDKESISHTAKLTRLAQYCTGKARRVIQCCMVYEPSAGYAKARQILREWFGNEYAITEAWITKIAKRPNIKPNDGYSLQELADELLTCRETLAAMDKDKTLKEKYITGMHDLFDKGYAERVCKKDLLRSDGAVWYLPHHPVFSPQKPEKTRIVYDCAAKYQGTSLNDNIHQGPDLTNKLIGVLLKFRQEPVALMAGIQEMFHQVHVTTEDRDVLRFLWWDQDDSSKEPLVYRMTVHLFGGVWSPSCSSYALRRTAHDHQQDYSVDVINTIQNNFYVDDCLKSVASDDRAVQLVQELCELLAKGGFRLTKWVSTSREVLKSIPESERAKDVKCLDLDRENLPIERALGVLWDVQPDTFKFKINMKEKPPTRRGLLSMVSSIYDPLGFVGPYVLLAKMLFQELCRRKVGWDDRMSQDVLDQWLRWLQDLPLLEQFSLPRCVRPPDFGTVVLCQLHHFSDASEKGYGAVTYLRMVDDLGGVYCCLLMSKSKLTPLKIKTIPRLELATAVVSVKLEKLMRQQLEIPVHESLVWTDSMIVLNYIMSQDKRFPPLWLIK